MDDSKPIYSKVGFLPCFLTRLTDSDPHVMTEKYFATPGQLKEDVLRNIEMILNSKSRLSDTELGDEQCLLNSVLGLGLADFCGESRSYQTFERLKHNIVTQLVYFEPRIEPASIEVKLLEKAGSLNHVREMEIAVVIEAKSVNLGLRFLSRIDLETGGVSIHIAK